MDRATVDPIANSVIDGLGGTGAVASMCEVADSAVSHWRREGIPKPRMQFLRLKRPDYDWSQVPNDYPQRKGSALPESAVCAGG